MVKHNSLIGCPSKNIDTNDNIRLNLLWNIPNSQTCAKKCEEDPRCEGWTFFTDEYQPINLRLMCDLYTELALVDFPLPSVISGPCPLTGK